MPHLILTKSAEEKIALAKDILRMKDTGHVFSIINVKKDGTLREYKAMTKVQAGLVGGESTTAHKPNLLTIFDVGDGVNEYRAVNLETLLMLKFHNEEFLFVDEATANMIAHKETQSYMKTSANILRTTIGVVEKVLKG